MSKNQNMIISCVFAFIFSFYSLSFCIEEKTEKVDIIKLLGSSKPLEKRDGLNQIVEQRKKIIDLLLSILNSPLIENEEFYNSNTLRNISIYVLGTIKAEQAVPQLIKWIEPREGQSTVIDELRMLSPAGEALVHIGLPSVDPLIEMIKDEGTSTTGSQCLKIVVRILGVDIIEMKLNKSITSELMKDKKENLEAALRLLKSKNFHIKALDRRIK